MPDALEQTLQKLGVRKTRRHIFLCCDQTVAKCSSQRDSLESWEFLKRRLVDLVEPLSDTQLLELADGIHDMLRQRRSVRSHHAQRMGERTRRLPDLGH